MPGSASHRSDAVLGYGPWQLHRPPRMAAPRHIHDEARANGARLAARLLSANDVAELSGLSYHAVLRAIRSGELKASKRRGRILIRHEWFDEWIDGGVVEIRPAPALADIKNSPARARRGHSCRGSLERLRAIETSGA